MQRFSCVPDSYQPASWIERIHSSNILVDLKHKHNHCTNLPTNELASRYAEICTWPSFQNTYSLWRVQPPCHFFFPFSVEMIKASYPGLGSSVWAPDKRLHWKKLPNDRNSGFFINNLKPHERKCGADEMSLLKGSLPCYVLPLCNVLQMI